MNLFQKIKAWFRVVRWTVPNVNPTPVPAPVPTPGPAILPHDLDPELKILLDNINSLRLSDGLPKLDQNLSLCASSQNHANMMAYFNRLTHQCVGESPLSDRISAEKYLFSTIGEIIASGQPSAEQAVSAWLDDPPHRAIMLGQFRDFGGGMARSPQGVPYWCVDFGTPQAGGAEKKMTSALWRDKTIPNRIP